MEWVCVKIVERVKITHFASFSFLGFIGFLLSEVIIDWFGGRGLCRIRERERET